jgi:hypothetical protein
MRGVFRSGRRLPEISRFDASETGVHTRTAFIG